LQRLDIIMGRPDDMTVFHLKHEMRIRQCAVGGCLDAVLDHFLLFTHFGL
jgi:hypothetical protein